MSSLCGVHGPNGVTSLVLTGGSLMSTGRDGCCRQLVLEPDGHIVEVSMFKVQFFFFLGGGGGGLPHWGVMCHCSLLASKGDRLD